MIDKKAHAHLAKDPVMKNLLVSTTLRDWGDPGDLFQEIAENILGQQLSGKAANTIIGRFKLLFIYKKGQTFPTPDQILALADQTIRDCGTSWAKVSYLKNLSQAVIDKTLDLEKLKTLPDEVVIEELIKIKGIGRWTAEMVLIFYLRRPDIFSLGDQGLRNAMVKHYKIDIKDLKKMAKIAQKWSPHRSLASRYLWESLNNR